MTEEMTIAEQNKMIAEFMGLQPNPHDAGKTWSADLIIKDGNHYGDWQPLKYDCSWAWLMPVWLKILKWGSEYNGVQWSQEIDQEGVRMSDNRNGKFRAGSFKPRGTVDITDVYHCVVDFIKWYTAHISSPAPVK